MLPEIISKEPLGPTMRHGDDQWFDIVKWVHFAMVTAEELGVTKANLNDQLKSENPDVKRLLGTEGNAGEQLGLTKDWAVRIIRHVGNYGEVVRAQCRAGFAAEDRPRPQRAVEQGRPAIRAADPLRFGITSRPEHAAPAGGGKRGIGVTMMRAAGDHRDVRGTA